MLVIILCALAAVFILTSAAIIHRYYEIEIDPDKIEAKRKKARYYALEVAGWFVVYHQIQRKKTDDDELTVNKLNYYLYFAEGFSLSARRKSLFKDKIYAIDSGPEIKSLRHHYDDPYCIYPDDPDFENYDKIRPEDVKLLEKVYQKFNQYSTSGLSKITRKEKPWKLSAILNRQYGNEISRTVMRMFFDEKYYRMKRFLKKSKKYSPSEYKLAAKKEQYKFENTRAQSKSPDAKKTRPKKGGKRVAK